MGEEEKVDLGKGREEGRQKLATASVPCTTPPRLEVDAHQKSRTPPSARCCHDMHLTQLLAELTLSCDLEPDGRGSVTSLVIFIFLI